LAQLSEFFDVHVNQITTWKAQLEVELLTFSVSGGNSTDLPPIDAKSLHRRSAS